MIRVARHDPELDLIELYRAQTEAFAAVMNSMQHRPLILQLDDMGMNATAGEVAARITKLRFNKDKANDNSIPNAR